MFGILARREAGDLNASKSVKVRTSDMTGDSIIDGGLFDCSRVRHKPVMPSIRRAGSSYKGSDLL